MPGFSGICRGDAHGTLAAQTWDGVMVAGTALINTAQCNYIQDLYRMGRLWRSVFTTVHHP